MLKTYSCKRRVESPGLSHLNAAQRDASSSSRNVIAERGSASPAIAVKWLVLGMIPKRASTPAALQTPTIVLLCRKYSLLSYSPTTASRLVPAGAFQNSGLAAAADASSRCIGLLIV